MMAYISIWHDPKLVYGIAITAVLLLIATVWLFRRRRQSGRQAGVVCLLISIILHIILIICLPKIWKKPAGAPSPTDQAQANTGMETITFSTFEDTATIDESAGTTAVQPVVEPLPIAAIEDLLDNTDTDSLQFPDSSEDLLGPSLVLPQSTDEQAPEPADIPDSLAFAGEIAMPSLDDAFDRSIGEIADAPPSLDAPSLESPMQNFPVPDQIAQPAVVDSYVGDQPREEAMADRSGVPSMPASLDMSAATVPGDLLNDFANRTGQAKDRALQLTGGNADTEAAVAQALKFLSDNQQPDGSWNPSTTGAGVERAPLGENRHGAGSNAHTALTGLALMTMMGAGNTHQEGEYADNVYRGLAYLIRSQKPNGSLAGNASAYSSTYCHGIASLAICEATAMTKDPSAMACAERAIAYTLRMQHPATGGWRYLKGDPGDLSQLGWQAMVLDAGNRAGISIDRRSVAGVERFLTTVRAGQNGGLASYRANERATVTMTAEALATRLMIGQRVPKAEVDEAETFMLSRKPGTGQDNYYFWYYATLAMHQMQDDAWQEWNTALQARLLETQTSNGSWPTDSVWGGYGGSVYSTSMATLCLESYYRHAIRSSTTRIARLPN